MKVLIFAYACEPNRGSEPGLGWNISGEIARHNEVTLVTRANNKGKIEEYLATHAAAPQSRIKFEYFDRGGVLLRLKKFIPLGTQLYFSSWLKAAARGYSPRFPDFDVVHQLTFSPFFVRPWGAEYTTKYVWGPIGGGGGPDARMGRSFLKEESFGAAFGEWLYRTISWLVNKSVCGKGFRKTRGKVRAVLFKAKAFSAEYVPVDGQLVKITRETGYSGEFNTRPYNAEKHPLQIMMVGRMIPFKAFGYGIKAFAQFIKHGGEGVLTLFGDGPLRDKLEKLALDLDVKDKVAFKGNVPNAEVHKALDSSDVYFHPSFIEAAAWSIIEAMIHGVPVLCQDRSGMADMMTPECGTIVKAETPRELVEMCANALMRYYVDPSVIPDQGAAGQRRVKEHYSWEAIGKQFEEVYHAI